MYQIIATEDFINVLRDLPLKYIDVLSKSFISIDKIDIPKTDKDSFLKDLMSQLQNQEIE